MADLDLRLVGRLLPRVAVVAIAWCTLTGGVFSGCPGLFTPALPEPPSGKPIVHDYRSPETTLRTMALGLQAKGQGASAWLGAFADSSPTQTVAAYHQFFDPADLEFFEGACGCEAPTDWRTSQEQVFYLEFLSVRPSDDYAVQFEVWVEKPDPPAGNDQVTLHRRYRVLASALDQSSTMIIAVGYADLTFKKIDANWLITRWDDHVDPLVGVNPSDPEQLTLGRRRLESTR